MTNAIQSICPFCSMGCTLLLRPASGSPYIGEADVASLDYDPDGPFNRGSLCAKGNMALELLTHTGRLESPCIRSDGRFVDATWEDALQYVTGRVDLLRQRFGPRAIGILVGSHVTNEEARLAAELGRRLGTPNVDGGQPEDRALLAGLGRAPASPRPLTTIDQVSEMTALLAVGDVFTVAPCLSKSVLHARYDQRQNVLATLSSVRTRTTWFGKPDLCCNPARETAALALLLRTALATLDARQPPWADTARAALEGLELEALSGLNIRDAEQVVNALGQADASGVFTTSLFGDTERPDLAAGLAALLAEVTGSRFLALGHGPNSLGVRKALADAGYPDPRGFSAAEMFEAAATGDLRALLVFGCDPLAALPGLIPDEAVERLDLFAITAPHVGESTRAAHVVFPATAWGEKLGTITNAFGASLNLLPALTPPGSSCSDEETLGRCLERLAPWEEDASPTAPAPGGHRGARAPYFGDLELYFRLERRELGAREVGTHLLLPEAVASHSADGWLTRALSWPRHELPVPEVVLSASHAAAIGLRAGQRARVRSRSAETTLSVRIEPRLPDDVVLAPAHVPEVRRLMRWRIDPALRDLELQPCRVSVEKAEEIGDV